METERWTLDPKWTRNPILMEGDSKGADTRVGLDLSVTDNRRNLPLGRLTCAVCVVLLTLVVSGSFCFLFQQTAILRLETERLKLRLRVVELQIERCNALFEDDDADDDGWGPEVDASPSQSSVARISNAVESEEVEDGPPSSASSSSSSSSSSSLSSSLFAKKSSSSSSSSSLSSSVLPWRRKRNAANKKKPNKEKQKTPKEFAFSFETERPLACKQTNCLSLTGWKPSPWVDAAHHRLYNDLSGQLDIPVAGLHYIYAQVTYETVSALEAFAIMVDNEQLGRCLTGVDYVNPALNRVENVQRKTCHTGLAVHLRKNQKVWIKSLHMDGEQISVVSMRNASFWGVVKLSAK